MTMKVSPVVTSFSSRLSSIADEDLLSSFDPVIEVGASFSSGRSRTDDEISEESLPEGMAFDLSQSLANIPQKLFFRIGEVAELLDVKTYVLRFWETEFPTIHPTKSKTGQRVYRKKDVETLFLIKHLLYVERFSIEGARKRLKEIKKQVAHQTDAALTTTWASKNSAKLSSSKKEELKDLTQGLLQDSHLALSQLFKY